MHGWWQHFCQRNRGISRSAFTVSLARAKATDIVTFLKIPRIYNPDESGMPLNPKGVKMVVKTACVGSVSGDSKSQLTVVIFVPTLSQQ